MIDKKTYSRTQDAVKKPAFSKPLLIFVCIFVSIVLVFTITLGTIMGVKNARAAVKYDGLTMDRECVSFFASYYKTIYMSALSKPTLFSEGVKNVSDTRYFWESVSESGETYGELLESGVETYIKQMMVAVYLYDNYASFSAKDKEKVESAVSEVLAFKADGNRDTFNSLVEKYGFSYDSFVDAAEMLYKYSTVASIIYGADGSKISALPELCDEFLNTYSHVKLLFIRTEDEFMTDEDGNRIEGEDGYATRPLTDKEKEERNAAIADIRACIEALKSGGDVLMSPELFDSYLKKYDNASSIRHTSGYYLNGSSKYTAGFAENVSKEVVKSALKAEAGSYTEVEWESGVCFIYKYEPSKLAYSNSALEIYFEDFYNNAATYFFEKTLRELSVGVELTDKYSPDPITTPYNTVFIPKF